MRLLRWVVALGLLSASVASAAGPVASVVGGRIAVNGSPFLMIAAWGQCAADVEGDLALGVNTFVTSLCDESALATAAAARGAYVIGEIGGDQNLPGAIGFLQPDEPDANGISAAQLATPPGNGKLTLVNLTMNLWSRASRNGIDYSAYYPKGDLLSTDVYPVELTCHQAPWVGFETVYDIQRELAAHGKPAGQWLEVNAVDNTCPGAVLTGAMVQAEAWQVIAAGGTWIGWFFPHSVGGAYQSFDATPEITAAVGAVNKQLQALRGPILAPRLVLSSPWGNGKAAGYGSVPIKIGGSLYKGRNYLFATNTTGSTVTWRHKLPGLAAGARLRRELVTGAATPGKTGALTLAFAPYETRVYSWVPKAS